MNQCMHMVVGFILWKLTLRIIIMEHPIIYEKSHYLSEYLIDKLRSFM
jgi:hypothetical protein